MVDQWCRWCNKQFLVSRIDADEHVDFSDKIQKYTGMTPEEFDEQLESDND